MGADYKHSRRKYARYLNNYTKVPSIAAGAASSAFGVIGRVYLGPIDIPFICTLDQLIVAIGGVGAGNMRVGLYHEGPNADLPDGGALVVESGSVAQGGANRPQPIAIADTPIQPGQYFIAIMGSDVLGTFMRINDTTNAYERRFDQAYAAFTDPCPATIAQNIHPLACLRVATIP